MLCGAILDGAIICAILMIINRDESPDFWPAVGCALIASILGFGVERGITLGTGNQLLGFGAQLIVMGIAVAASFVIVFSSEIGKACLGGAMFVGIKLVLIIIFVLAFSTIRQPESSSAHRGSRILTISNNLAARLKMLTQGERFVASPSSS